MEDGTPAVKIEGHMVEEIKEERHNKIMEAQQIVSEEFNASLIEKTFECIVKVDGHVLGHGIGSSKKSAEQEAAKEALSKQAK